MLSFYLSFIPSSFYHFIALVRNLAAILIIRISARKQFLDDISMVDERMKKQVVAH